MGALSEAETDHLGWLPKAQGGPRPEVHWLVALSSRCLQCPKHWGGGVKNGGVKKRLKGPKRVVLAKWVGLHRGDLCPHPLPRIHLSAL